VSVSCIQPLRSPYTGSNRTRVFVNHAAICKHRCEGPPLCRIPDAHRPGKGKASSRRTLADATTSTPSLLQELHTSLSAQRAALQRSAAGAAAASVEGTREVEDAVAGLISAVSDSAGDPDSEPALGDAADDVAAARVPAPVAMLAVAADAELQATPLVGDVAGAPGAAPQIAALQALPLAGDAAQMVQLQMLTLMNEMRRQAQEERQQAKYDRRQEQIERQQAHQQAQQHHVALMNCLTSMAKAMDPANATARQSAQAKRKRMPDQEQLMEHLKDRLASESKQRRGLLPPPAVRAAGGGLLRRPAAAQQTDLQRLLDEAADDSNEQEDEFGDPDNEGVL
jgi:hypothetical protein